MNIELKDDQTIIHCGESLTLDTIHDQFDNFKKALEQKKPIVLEAQSVNRIGTGSLQLILSLILTLKKENISFKWQGVSDSFKDKANILGFSKDLNISSNQ